MRRHFFRTLIPEWTWAIRYRLLCFFSVTFCFYIIYEKQNKNKASREIHLEGCYRIGTTSSRTHVWKYDIFLFHSSPFPLYLLLFLIKVNRHWIRTNTESRLTLVERNVWALAPVFQKFLFQTWWRKCHNF